MVFWSFLIIYISNTLIGLGLGLLLLYSALSLSLFCSIFFLFTLQFTPSPCSFLVALLMAGLPILWLCWGD